MIAYQVNSYGPSAQFKEVEIDPPNLQDGQVLIEVQATSVNPIDHKLLRQQIGLNPELPAVLHGDVSGTIVGKAEDVTKFEIGDEVYGCAGGFIGSGGALAQFMAADANLLAYKPERLTFFQAAALPLVSITAWESLVDSARIGAGEHALIHGGTGGVGHVALQIAKAKGLLVSVTVGSESAAKIASSLGADNVILYKEEPVDSYVGRLTGGKGFDVVYDTVGGANVEASLQAVKNYGRIITVFTGTDSPTIDLTTAFFKAVTVHTQNMSIPLVTGVGRSHHGEILEEIKELVEDGKIEPLIANEIFQFRECNSAHSLLESGDYVGKIVISGW